MLIVVVVVVVFAIVVVVVVCLELSCSSSSSPLHTIQFTPDIHARHSRPTFTPTPHTRHPFTHPRSLLSPPLPSLLLRRAVLRDMPILPAVVASLVPSRGLAVLAQVAALAAVEAPPLGHPEVANLGRVPLLVAVPGNVAGSVAVVAGLLGIVGGLALAGLLGNADGLLLLLVRALSNEVAKLATVVAALWLGLPHSLGGSFRHVFVFLLFCVGGWRGSGRGGGRDEFFCQR